MLLFLGLPRSTSAASVAGELEKYRGNICGGGMVPDWMCGMIVSDGSSNILGKVVSSIIDFSAGVGVCVFIYACIRIIVSQGQDDKVAAAKKMAVIALIGVFIALSVEPIMNAIRDLLGNVIS
ncbi:hypothetical protein A2947_03665 [Candidatus Peribacteria bacterium RIFCSPLOWO2_01_FULL_54_110]|nr:MAG: hypothetical protein A2789_03140 [Candidatus Peribacteria bacterium RIFCSPHIGHO2_01_FULL_54_22]OGJ63984.1 MAG: hypothetical protein A3E47_02655 [Candidatus Peribacteria bacterium RIFCSPHIGHO2_12_FULL_54_10]OGJ67908.1 MAG: hypothetical protein A2947_03665 [Candidatus Peribacteria bacterium RIFCSPLOWO2_01_FULL_54_110]